MYTQDREEMADGEGSPINAKQLGMLMLAILPSQQLGSPRSRRKEIERGQVKVCPSNLPK